MNNWLRVALAALLLHIGIGCEPRKVPNAPDPIPDQPGDPNQHVPNPASTVGEPIAAPIAADVMAPALSDAETAR